MLDNIVEGEKTALILMHRQEDDMVREISTEMIARAGYRILDVPAEFSPDAFGDYSDDRIHRLTEWYKKNNPSVTVMDLNYSIPNGSDIEDFKIADSLFNSRNRDPSGFYAISANTTAVSNAEEYGLPAKDKMEFMADLMQYLRNNT